MDTGNIHCLWWVVGCMNCSKGTLSRLEASDTLSGQSDSPIIPVGIVILIVSAIHEQDMFTHLFNRLGKQFVHFEFLFTQLQFLQEPVLLHLQEVMRSSVRSC